MVTLTRVNLGTINARMPPERACNLARSDVVSYDNLTRVADNTAWSYNGGPNNNGTYTGATGYQSLLGAYCSRPDKMRFEWSYSMSNAVALAAALKPKLIGGTINGLVNNVAELASFGSVLLYGTRYDHIGSGNSLADITNPAEQARLLGDDPNAAAYSDNMRGISNWAAASASFKAILHDDGACMFAGHSANASFRSTTWSGFSGHGSAVDYGQYLRGIYASESAYDTARAAGSVPAYTAARQWLLDKVYAWHGTAAARAAANGMSYALNIAGPLPTKHPQTAFAMIGNTDFVVCEMPWQTIYREGSAGRLVSDRAAAENLSDATTLRRMFSSMALYAMTVRGAARKFTFAPYPLVDWIPPKSAGSNSPPTTSPYTVPYKVTAHQKISWAWIQALGGPSIIPAGVYDEAPDTPAYGYTGYTGSNKPFFYMPPASAKPWFDWVAANSDLLDPFDIAATVAIVQPLGVSFWRGAVDGASNNAWVWMDSYVRPLVEANVPFVILPVDSGIGYPASGYDLSQYLAVVNASNDTLTLPGSLSNYAPVTVAGSVDSTRPVFCITRVDRARNRLAIHVVNSHSCDYTASSGAGGAGTTQTAIMLTLKPWAMLSRTLKNAHWYTHESSTQGVPVRVSTSAQGVTLNLPSFLEAGVVLLEFK